MFEDVVKTLDAIDQLPKQKYQNELPLSLLLNDKQGNKRGEHCEVLDNLHELFYGASEAAKSAAKLIVNTSLKFKFEMADTEEGGNAPKKQEIKVSARLHCNANLFVQNLHKNFEQSALASSSGQAFAQPIPKRELKG